MTTFKQGLVISAMAAALGCAGTAFGMTKAEIKAEKDRIAADFKAAKSKCKDFKGNAKDICMAEAKGSNKVAKAEFAAHQDDTAKARYNVRVARAEADYAVAKEKCDDKAGNVKDVCVKDAKAALKSAKADAKADLKSGKAQTAANEKISEARKDANEDKRAANFAAAKERCDAFAGEAKERCVKDAKARFGLN